MMVESRAMRLFPLIILVVLLAHPITTFAEEAAITRSEGLTLIWQSLQRPIESTYEPSFADVPEGHPNHSLIRYAKARGIVENSAVFSPDAPLTLRDALLWLLRSRNVAAWSAITPESIFAHARRYGLLAVFTGTRDRSSIRMILATNPPLSQKELEDTQHALDEALNNELHTVSYYGNSFAGRRTAFGEIFDPGAMTAAHRTLPHNTLVRLTNTENGNTVTVRINDRGPYIAGRDMDLSRAAFEHLGPISRGIHHGISFERLGSSEMVEHRQEHEGGWHDRHAARRRARLAKRR